MLFTAHPPCLSPCQGRAVQSHPHDQHRAAKFEFLLADEHACNQVKQRVSTKTTVHTVMGADVLLTPRKLIHKHAHLRHLSSKLRLCTPTRLLATQRTHKASEPKFSEIIVTFRLPGLRTSRPEYVHSNKIIHKQTHKQNVTGAPDLRLRGCMPKHSLPVVLLALLHVFELA